MTSTYELASEATETGRKFPGRPYPHPDTFCDDYFTELARAARSIDGAAFTRAASLLLDAYVGGRRVFVCGNGGSASVANHLQCDHMKGVRNGTDLRPRVTSLAGNVELLTAIANDIGYEAVFVHQLESQGVIDDLLVTISSSGRSPNVLHALRWAGAHGLATISLTGFDGGEARHLADVALHVDSHNYGIVEDAHQALMHALAQYLRQSQMPDGDVADTTF